MADSSFNFYSTLEKRKVRKTMAEKKTDRTAFDLKPLGLDKFLSASSFRQCEEIGRCYIAGALILKASKGQTLSAEETADRINLEKAVSKAFRFLQEELAWYYKTAY